MIYLYLFGTCFHFIYVFMIIVKYLFKMCPCCTIVSNTIALGIWCNESLFLSTVEFAFVRIDSMSISWSLCLDSR